MQSHDDSGGKWKMRYFIWRAQQNSIQTEGVKNWSSQLFKGKKLHSNEVVIRPTSLENTLQVPLY